MLESHLLLLQNSAVREVREAVEDLEEVEVDLDDRKMATGHLDHKVKDRDKDNNSLHPEKSQIPHRSMRTDSRLLKEKEVLLLLPLNQPLALVLNHGKRSRRVSASVRLLLRVDLQRMERKTLRAIRRETVMRSRRLEKALRM